MVESLSGRVVELRGQKFNNKEMEYIFNMTDEQFMILAIKKAEQGIMAGQTPFGACIVKDDQVIACAHNVVWKTIDITAHAEIHAIRLACEELKTIDLSGCRIYSTCEPCPMCFSAIHWARIGEIFYGASIEDAEDAGFHELSISNIQMKDLGKSSVKVYDRILKRECCQLFDMWSKNNGQAY